MSRTVTALYKTRADAEQAREALRAAHVGDPIEIHDRSAAGSAGVEGHRDFVEWLGGLFSGHDDKHLYGEGLRRGHYLLTTTVDDFSETRAAEILDNTGPINLDDAHRDWQADGWTPPTSAAVGNRAPETGGVFGAEEEPDAEPAAPVYQLIGVRVRVYPVDG